MVRGDDGRHEVSDCNSRGDRECSSEIELSEERGKRIHLYCFFGSINRCDFSENLHLVL